MDLILWRHAEAEDGAPDQPDIERALTGKGRKQAAKMAEWLDRHLPTTCKILSSPAVRTVQTVEALDRKYKTHPGLAPDVSPESVLQAANWPNSREPVLIVGHQPTLGYVIAQLITGQQREWMLRKGSIYWISQKADGSEGNYIKAVMGPDLASK